MSVVLLGIRESVPIPRTEIIGLVAATKVAAQYKLQLPENKMEKKKKYKFRESK
jgi:hypothetical protein